MRIPTILAPYARLSRPVVALFFVQVVNRLGDFVAPFLALLLTRKLGFSEERAGFWVTVTVVASLAGIIAAGRVSDRWGRKAVLSGAMSVSAVVIAVSGFFLTDARVIALLVGMSFFQGMVRPAISALIADVTSSGERKDAYALSYLGINVGVAVGPMLAGFLFERYPSWLFWGDAATTLCALILVLAFIPGRQELAAKHSSLAESERAESGSASRAFLARPRLIGFCLLLAVVNIVYAQTHFALPMHMEGLFPARGAAVFGWLMSFNAVVVVSLTPVANHLTRKQSAPVSMALGSLLYAAGFGMLALPLELPFLFVSTFVWTLGEILFSINTGVFLAANTPANFRGQFQAYRECITSAGRIAGPFAGGLLIAGAGLSVLWLAVALVAFASAAGFIALERYRRRAS